MRELKAEELYRTVDLDGLDFETTDDLEPLEEYLGQTRAIRSMEFGVGIQRDGFNIYALGPHGAGKREIIEKFLDREAAERPCPVDWCYVNNFEEPNKPRVLSVPTGKAFELRRQLRRLVAELEDVLLATFEGEEYQTRRQQISREFEREHVQALDAVSQKAREQGIAMIRAQGGFGFAPLDGEEVMQPEGFAQLPEAERERFNGLVEALQGELQKVLRQAPRQRRELSQRMREIDEQFASFVVRPLIDELRARFKGEEQVLDYLDAVEKDMIENAHALIDRSDGSEEEHPESETFWEAAHRTSPADRYVVNVVVERCAGSGAPVVIADNPTYSNLLGRVEHVQRMGATVTDFSLIKPGALHRANGGYLVLEARRLLSNPFAWDGLKRALRAGQIKIESTAEAAGMTTVATLEPAAIPLDVKVVLTGDATTYSLLAAHDPDFSKLFKVVADFEGVMVREEESEANYARFIADEVKREALLPFSRSGVARVLERTSRQAHDSEKLSLHRSDVRDLLREADYWARQSKTDRVTRDDVQRAIEAKVHRSDRIRERMQEQILRGTVLIDSDGERIGQINGLSVLQLGDFAFGKPTRITARVRMGRGQLIDIEREVDLSGPIHSKGVLILGGYLGHTYARDLPLALSASLVFEQSYGGVDGDSASLAELVALLSAISGVPIRQSLAVTGAINQLGAVQAIGGVNEKIEGFYDVCASRGLTGEQGVVIPESNVVHLMLRRDIVDAVAEGRFHIHAVGHVDEGIEVLTGRPAGALDASGNFGEGLHRLVHDRLFTLAERARNFGKAKKDDASRRA